MFIIAFSGFGNSFKDKILWQIVCLYDMICSNPPYIPREDCLKLDPEVRLHDPMLALDGGEDGLDFYRALAERAGDSLKSGGYVVLELGIGQAEDVEKIFAPVADTVALIKDLAGIDRVLSLRKR